MSTLLENLAEFVKMIFGVIVTPNYAANNQNANLLRYLFYWSGDVKYYMLQFILLLPIGIMLIGVSVGILKRFLWKS